VKNLINIGIELEEYEELNINIEPNDHTICASLVHKKKDVVIYIKDLEYPYKFEILKKLTN
jgi:hypothetical protein